VYGSWELRLLLGLLAPITLRRVLQRIRAAGSARLARNDTS
jgi:hypothetical protein